MKQYYAASLPVLQSNFYTTLIEGRIPENELGRYMRDYKICLLYTSFDLFILDLMLPGIDGFEICKRIREKKNTPILMVSAKKDDIDKIRGCLLYTSHLF